MQYQKKCKNDEEKYDLLASFYDRLRNNEILLELQDIRYFAQIVGIKEITGRSRKEMMPRLMRILMQLPTDRIRAGIESAPSISETHREQGFSILADKLMGES